MWIRSLLLCAGSIGLSFAAAVSPQAVVEAFFSPAGIEDKRAVYTADMLSFLNERTLGQQLGKGVIKRFRQLSDATTEAIFAIEVADQGQVQDWYAYVRADAGVWKLAAVRSLSIAGLRSDASLRDYLRDHLIEFDALAAAVRNAAEQEVSAAVARLSLESCRPRPEGGVECVIARALRNSVGYLFLPEGVEPPRMTPDNVMYIEAIAGSWYIYKKT